MYKTIVFADFDGTITTEDTIVGSIRLFSDPKEVEEYNGKLERGEMTLSQVVRYAFEGAPSSCLPKMLEYVDGVGIRPGFPEFLRKMQVISPYDDGNELMKKTDVMALYQYEHAIGIGDSFTDLKMAQAVDTIFARDLLARYLKKIQKPYRPYETFYDIIDAMEEMNLP